MTTPLLGGTAPTPESRETDLPLAGSHVVVCNWRDSSHPLSGGAEQYCEQVAAEMAAQGAKVTYLTSRSRGTRRREPTPWGSFVRMGGTFTTYPLVLLWLLAHRRTVDGVVDSQNGVPYFTPLAIGRQVPVTLLIHHVHQQQFDQYFPWPLNLVGRFLEKQACRYVYGRRPICVVSPSTRASVRRQLRLRGPIHIAPNGLGHPSTPHLSSRAPSPTVVSVGRLVPHKRVEVVLDSLPGVLARHPDTVLHIVGDGECRTELELRSRALGLESNVVFHGRLSDEERDRLVARAWLTVIASAGEGWGLSVIEAAAYGVPAVAFRVPGLEDSVRPGETGWLVEKGQTMADAIGDALDTLANERMAGIWAARCQMWASAFTWAYTAERITSVLMSEARMRDHRYDERRSFTDSTTVVAMPPDAVGPEVLRRLRGTDQIRMDAASERVELLLSGADEADAELALARLGILPEKTYWARIARYRDHLGWQRREEYVSAHLQASGGPASNREGLLDEASSQEDPCTSSVPDSSG